MLCAPKVFFIEKILSISFMSFLRKSFWKDFIVDDRREYRYRVGSVIASGLSGFVAGIIAASIFWNLVSQ